MIAQLATQCGLELGLSSAASASRLLFETVPFYGGLALEEIGGKGVRWQERDAAEAYPREGSLR